MKTSRLFFALWPSGQARRSIVETFSQLPQPIKGRFVPPHNLHVTLHYVGSVTDEVKDCMHVAAQTINFNAFECHLDQFVFFPKAKIFWMGYQDTPVELMQLRNKLAAAIENCGYQREKRVFSPHVTLMRKYTNPVTAQVDFSIPWTVDNFVLVESYIDQHGANYQVIEKYPLS